MGWRLYWVTGLVASMAYWVIPPGLPRDVEYDLIGVCAVAAIAVGIRRNRPVSPAPWLIMLTGQGLWVLGDIVDTVYKDVAHDNSYPSWADACYLAAYPVLAIGLLLLIRGRLPRRDAGGLLDSATLTAGLGLLSWVLLARPTIDASQYSLSAAVVGVAYPVGDILLVGLLIRLVTTPGGRTTSFRLLFGAVLLLVAGDTTSDLLDLWSNTSTNAFDVIWLLSYICWGAAALHPSMATLSERARADSVQFTRRRVVPLALASLVAPATLIVQKVAGVSIDVWAIAVGSVLLFLLVVGRMNVAISQIVAANLDLDRMQASLAYQAAHDSLTGLPNRAHAVTSIEAALNRARRTGDLLGVLFIDLDGFKTVNDTFGHRAGDEVLRVVGNRLQDQVRAGDMVARLGGDEFVVLLESLEDETAAITIAERLVAILKTPIPVGDRRPAGIGASVGVAFSLDGSVDAGRLLHDADTAVYRAKSSGRGRVDVYDDALRRELDIRAELEAALRTAIAEDELVLHYQPIIELESGTVSGYEALVRWERPGHGLVPPMVFIPTAEASSLICELDAWVLDKAAAQLSEWAHPTQTVAVNISGRHIGDPRIVTDVRGALARSGLSPTQLVLEVTETVVVEDLLAVHHLQELRDLGVTIALDDFGTGYNSMARLQNLPIDVIKIDRSFLDMSAPSSLALLELMIYAAHAFGMPVIAEGVETRPQLDALRGMNCESVQGYFLSRPLTVEQVGRVAQTFAVQ